MAGLSISAHAQRAPPAPKLNLMELRAQELLLLLLLAPGLLLLRGPRALWEWYERERSLRGAERLGPYLQKDIGVYPGAESPRGSRIDYK